MIRGSAVIFNKWKRYNETLYDNVIDAVDDIFNLIKTELTDQPYALFGHSMGALLSYELVRKIKLLKMPEPKHVFISGRGAPHVKDEKGKKYHLMNDEEFKNEVIELGGTPAEFFEHKELTDYILPMLKNDFQLADVSFCEREIEPFDFDISVFLGKDEALNSEQIDGWKQHTNGLCTIYHFNGDHFFLHDKAEPIVKLINKTLKY